MKVKLGDIFEIGSGGTPSKSHPEYYGGNIPWVKTGDLKTTYLYNVEDFITEDGLNNSSAKMYEPDTVLIAMYGATIGATSILKINACTNQACAAFKPNDKVLPEYLYYFLRSKRNEFIKDGVGGAQPNISAGYLKNVCIELPSPEKQKEIVNVLNKVSGVIEMREQELLKLDDIIKARFVELFGAPEDSTTKWNRTNFASVCLDMHQGINTVADKVEYVNSGFPIIQSKNITSGYLDLEDVRYVKECDYEYYRNKYNPKPSDLLVCNIGTIGKSLIVEDVVDFLIAWNLFLIKLNKELVNPVFVKVYIELLNQQNYFEKYMTGGTVKFVNKKTMGAISTPIPPMELQNQFATFVAQTDKSKIVVQKALDEAQLLFDSLIQKYFG